MKIKLPANPHMCPHHDRYCASVRFPVLSGCDCAQSHPQWKTSDGTYGVCMMAPAHIENCIRMLIANLRKWKQEDNRFFPWWDNCPSPIFFSDLWINTEEKLSMFLKERDRRIKLGRWKNVAN